MAKAKIKISSELDARKFEDGMKKMNRRMNVFKQRLGGIKSALVATFGAAAMVRFVKSSIDLGSELSDLAESVGINVEALQIFNAAARDAGANSENVRKAFVSLKNATQDARDGLTTYTRAFEALGINIEEFIKQPLELQLEQLSKAYVLATDETEAFRAVTALLGTRNAPRLLEVIKKLGVEGFEALSRQIRETNRIVDEETIRQSDQLADEFNNILDNAKKAGIVSVVAFANIAKALKVAVTEGKSLGDALESIQDTSENITVDPRTRRLSRRLAEIEARRVRGRKKFLEGMEDLKLSPGLAAIRTPDRPAAMGAAEETFQENLNKALNDIRALRFESIGGVGDQLARIGGFIGGREDPLQSLMNQSIRIDMERNKLLKELPKVTAQFITGTIGQAFGFTQ